MRARLVLGLWLLAAAADALAGGVELLRAFVAEVRSARLEFRQVVSDPRGKILQESSGSFQFERPGRFRWATVKPWEQLVVGDGRRVWVYDRDLEQVTVKALGDALGSSPAALLAGGSDVDRAWTFTALARDEGLDWVEATPRDPESTFERMRIGFRRSDPVELRLQDRLGQSTTVRFSRLERNPRLPADTFRFTPPKGVDVVGDR